MERNESKFESKIESRAESPETYVMLRVYCTYDSWYMVETHMFQDPRFRDSSTQKAPFDVVRTKHTRLVSTATRNHGDARQHDRHERRLSRPRDGQEFQASPALMGKRSDFGCNSPPRAIKVLHLYYELSC